MDTNPFAKLQSAETGESTCRLNHFRFNVINILDDLNEAMEALANGECIRAKKIIEKVHSHIEEISIQELAMIRSLADYDRVSRIDEALHQRRRRFVDDFTKKEGAVATWSGDNFELILDGVSFVRVDANDNWTAISGVPNYELPGVGLTALHAHLSGKLLPESISLLTKWLQGGSAGK